MWIFELVVAYFTAHWKRNQENRNKYHPDNGPSERESNPKQDAGLPTMKFG
jgi:hypothetical protein